MASQDKLRLTLDYKILTLVLLAVIFGMLGLWRPWQNNNNVRTIKVTGEATIKAEPDEFVFYPTYEFKGNNHETQLDELSKKSESLIKKLKDLGVPDSKIKTNASNYDYKYYPVESAEDNPVYTLQLTITLSSREESQKVQDFLTTTNPTGQITPQAGFSEAKRNELESRARDEATKSARAKADQSANNLGFKIGRVKSVEDGIGFQNIYATPAVDSAEGRDMAADPKISVQPGENEVTYSVSVEYYLK